MAARAANGAGDRGALRDASASYLRKAGSHASTFYNDENENSSSSAAEASSFADLAQAFNSRITELQQLMCLRIEDHAKHLFVAELRGIDASVRALERSFKDIREHLARETAAMPKARALLQAARVQQQALAEIGANLPTHLPSAPGGVGLARGGGGGAGSGNSSSMASASGDAAAGGVASSAAAAAAAAAAGLRGRRDAGAGAGAGPSAAANGPAAAAGGGPSSSAAAGPVAPRWYVTQPELSSLASYMRGRLTLDKVNSALDEAALHAEQLARWMAAVRAHQPNRVPLDERKRATDIFHMLANKEGVRGQYFFTEAELRNGAALRPDKTGKALLMVLRHLGRIAEVRFNVEALGGALIVYVLVRPS